MVRLESGAGAHDLGSQVDSQVSVGTAALGSPAKLCFANSHPIAPPGSCPGFALPFTAYAMNPIAYALGYLNATLRAEFLATAHPRRFSSTLSDFSLG